MRLRTPLLALVLACLAAPAQARHAEEPPTFDDAAGDAGAAAKWGDLTTGWLHDAGAELVLELDVAELAAAQPPLAVWFVVADVGGASFAWGAYVDVGAIGYVHGRWDRASNGPVTLEDGNGTFEPGTPGRVTASIPKAYIATQLGHALPAGTPLEGLLAASGQAVGGVLALGVTVRNLDEADGLPFAMAAGAEPSQGWRWVNGSEPAQRDEPGQAPPQGAQRTPAPPWALALALVAGSAWLAARRR